MHAILTPEKELGIQVQRTPYTRVNTPPHAKKAALKRCWSSHALSESDRFLMKHCDLPRDRWTLPEGGVVEHRNVRSQEHAPVRLTGLLAEKVSSPPRKLRSYAQSERSCK